ncbi:hypothetical protein RHGRI_030824 [Rhododendron griersonianum]|uniref:Uncharacterized protein n=1 Tax=Rhododendron griersonianum TaxID=479676 RepID=A0AAV6IA46_9ERIC|nr:hypothetical protein RHGRI_030824 [Rhododendron griersonianum]
MGPLHHFHPNFLTAFLFSCSGIINHQFPDSDMDKNWMKMGMTADGRISQLYYNGVTSFIQFARAVIDAQDDVRYHEMRDGDLGGIDALVEDRIRGEPIDATEHEEVQNFDKLLNDSQREIYPECIDAFQQESMTSGVPIDIEGNIWFRREDVEVEVIAGVGPLHETTENLTNDEVDEEHEIIGEDINNKAGEDDELSDADMDPDMDYDA